MQNYKLFTPGPLNISSNVRSAMNVDIGSRTKTIVELTKTIRMDLESIAKCGINYTSILLQGSGTFATEAMILSLIDNNDHVLVVSNGVYSERIYKICTIHKINCLILKSENTAPIKIEKIRECLQKERKITTIIAVQFETTIGILNDVNELISLASNYNCQVLIDAISSFGVLPLNYTDALTAVVSSSNKCLHGAPGVAFVIVNKKRLIKSKLNKTLSLDLKAQWQEFEDSGQWRFTPPTHILLGFKEALNEFKKLGGMSARLKKYTYLTNKLIEGLAKIDIYPVIRDEYRASIITTFILGDSHSITTDILYEKLFHLRIVIYSSDLIPGKTFRIGCMGDLDIDDIKSLINAITTVISSYWRPD
jgi:2-aminoethylphosphonate-pyruvate transaminase